MDVEASGAPAAAAEPGAPADEAPLFVCYDGLQWVRTEVQRGTDLVNGEAWIHEFNKRLAEHQQQQQVQQQARPAAPRRMLRATATDGDAPNFWAARGNLDGDLAPVQAKNEVLKSMHPGTLFPDASRGCGKKVRLATGQDVIFWFNVGPDGPPRSRVHVTAAYCPHQGVCLNTGELKDIEDMCGVKRAMIRCPRHNKTFDILSGESLGNAEKLQTYPCRYERDHWYVAVGEAPMAQAAASAAPAGAEAEADVDMGAEEPVPKKPRADEPDAPSHPAPGTRSLAAHNTLC